MRTASQQRGATVCLEVTHHLRSPGCRNRAPRSARAFLPGRNSLTTLAAAHWPDRVRAPLRFRRSSGAAWRGSPHLLALGRRHVVQPVLHFDQQRIALLAVIRVAQGGGHHDPACPALQCAIGHGRPAARCCAPMNTPSATSATAAAMPTAGSQRDRRGCAPAARRRTVAVGFDGRGDGGPQIARGRHVLRQLVDSFHASPKIVSHRTPRSNLSFSRPRARCSCALQVPTAMPSIDAASECS